jgi:hypothetical protein
MNEPAAEPPSVDPPRRRHQTDGPPARVFLVAAAITTSYTTTRSLVAVAVTLLGLLAAGPLLALVDHLYAVSQRALRRRYNRVRST